MWCCYPLTISVKFKFFEKDLFVVSVVCLWDSVEFIDAEESCQPSYSWLSLDQYGSIGDTKTSIVRMDDRCVQTVANPAKAWLCPSIRRCCPSKEKDLLTILDSHPATCHIVPDFASSGRMWTPTLVFVDLLCSCRRKLCSNLRCCSPQSEEMCPTITPRLGWQGIKPKGLAKRG
ncbi:hypothetical protein Ancab_024484 [Ancistrocladus abbreviatus]